MIFFCHHTIFTCPLYTGHLLHFSSPSSIIQMNFKAAPSTNPYFSPYHHMLKSSLLNEEAQWKDKVSSTDYKALFIEGDSNRVRGRQRGPQNKDQSKSRLKSRGRLTCFYFGKPRHFQKNYRHYRKDKGGVEGVESKKILDGKNTSAITYEWRGVVVCLWIKLCKPSKRWIHLGFRFGCIVPLDTQEILFIILNHKQRISEDGRWRSM